MKLSIFGEITNTKVITMKSFTFRLSYVFTLALLVISMGASAQWTYTVNYVQNGGNPGGLVTTDEQNSVLDLQQINGNPDKVEFFTEFEEIEASCFHRVYYSVVYVCNFDGCMYTYICMHTYIVYGVLPIA